jgi:hypothetical protein
MKFRRSLGLFVAALALTAWSGWANAQQRDTRWGTTAAPAPSGAATAAAQPAATTPNYTPSERYRNAAVATAGVSLRNRQYGFIHVSGSTGSAKGAWLYWAVITRGAPTSADTNVFLIGINAGKEGKTVSLTGTAIGTGASPCWLGDRVTVYRSAVPLSAFGGGTFNGVYLVEFGAGASGSNGGEDPWITSPLPELEGASLVMISAGPSTVAVFDKGLAGIEFASSAGLTYDLTLPVTAKGASAVLFHEIGADGQQVTGGIADNSGISMKTTSINGKIVAGPGGIDAVPDWDGTAGEPLPQLWDDNGHDITTAAASGGTKLKVHIIGGKDPTTGGSDCLVTVANIVAIQ